jgi:hypothetical protein
MAIVIVSLSDGENIEVCTGREKALGQTSIVIRVSIRGKT